MKKLTLIFTFAVALVSCQAAPPAHKTFTLTAAVATNSPPITGVNFYKAHPADTVWTPAGYVAATNGALVSLSYDPTFELWTADTTNSVSSVASDYAPIYTNAIPTAPALKP